MSYNANDFVGVILDGFDARLRAIETRSISQAGVVVVVGDSIAAGYRPDQSGQPSDGAFGWPQRMGFPSGVTVNNLQPYARTGSTVAEVTTDVPNGLSALYDASKTCVAIIERGTNDIRGFGSTGGNIDQLYSLVTDRVAQYKAQGFLVAVCTVLPFTDGASGAGNIAAYNSKVRANAAKADVIIDLANDPVMGAANAPNDTSLYVDKLHPTDAGMIRLGAAARSAVDGMLRNAPRAVTNANYVGTALTMTNAAYAAGASGFGQHLSGGFGTSPTPAGGIPTQDTWSIELFATFGAAGSNAMVLTSQDTRFAIAMSSDGHLQATISDSAGQSTFFAGGGYGGGGTLPVLTNAGRKHIRLSCKPGSQALEMDGQTLATLSLPSLITSNGATPFRVRAHGNKDVAPGDFAFNGPVDEVAIFNTYRAGIASPTAPYTSSTAGMVQLWHLDGNGSAA